MYQTEKVIDFYTDVFGNEIDVYEEREKYTVNYKGVVFEGDEPEKWNGFDTDNWEDAISFYNQFDGECYITDNEYGVTFSNGEWY